MFSLGQPENINAFALETEKIAVLGLLLHERGRTAAQKIHKAEGSRQSDGSLPFD